jgi:hypothetical protein
VLSLVLSELEALSPAWAAFWGRDEHLSHLCEVLLLAGEDAGPVWEKLCGMLTPEALWGDPFQGALLVHLTAARARFGQALLERVGEVIGAWTSLREHFERASAVTDDQAELLAGSCRTCGLDPLDGLRRYFTQYVLPHQLTEERLADFAGFFHSFFPGAEAQLRNPEEADHFLVMTRVVAWLEVVRVCAAGPLAVAQAYYLRRFVPELFLARVVGELVALEKVPAGVLGPAQEPTPAQEPATAEPTALPVKPTEPPAEQAGLQASAGWLLAALAGGVVSVLLFWLFPLPADLALPLARYLPIPLLLAGAMAQFASSRPTGGHLVWGLVGGGVSGLLAFGAATALGLPDGARLCLAAWAGVGPPLGPATALSVAWLLRVLRIEPHVSYGAIAYGLAVAGAAMASRLLAFAFLGV